MLVILLICVAIVYASAEDLWSDIKEDREDMWLWIDINEEKHLVKKVVCIEDWSDQQTMGWLMVVVKDTDNLL